MSEKCPRCKSQNVRWSAGEYFPYYWRCRDCDTRFEAQFHPEHMKNLIRLERGKQPERTQ